MLYIIATPIGNINDLSFRQAELIQTLPFLYGEDTRSVEKLQRIIEDRMQMQRNPLQKVHSFYKEVEFERVPQIIDRLKTGEDVGVVSDAGMPIISDPGYLLVKTVIKYELPYTVVPGPSAVTTALLHSGFNPAQFIFVGFLPKKTSHVQKEILSWKTLKAARPDIVIVFFESPHRIKETLAILAEEMPLARLAICRELTKMHEEIVRGVPQELLENEYRGELTVVLE